MATMRLEILLQAVDRLSAPVTAARAKLEALTRPIQAVAAATARVAAAPGWRLLGASLAATTRGAMAAASAVTSLGARAGLLGTAVGGVGIFAFNNQVIAGAASLQQFRLSMETVTGSSQRAGEAMAWIDDFTRRVPVGVQAAREAFQGLAVAGLDPTQGLMQAAADAASARGKSISYAAEAITGALRGEFDMLQQFGVNMSNEGRNAVVEWEANGRRFRAVVDRNNRSLIASFIQRGLSEKFAGETARQATSWNGLMQLLNSSWARFTQGIADGGIFAALEARLQRLQTWAMGAEADGSFARWGRQISEALEGALNAVERFIVGTDETPSALQRLQTAFETVRGVIQPLVDRFGGLNVALSGLFVLLGGGSLVAAVTGLATMTAGIAAFGLALSATPAGWFLGAIAAIAFVVYKIYKNWGAIADWFGGIWTRVRDGMGPQVRWLIEAAESIGQPLVDGITRAWGTLTNVFEGVWKGITEPFVQMWDTISPILRQVGIIQGTGGAVPAGPEPAAGAPGARRMGRNGAQRIEGFDPPADPAAAGVYIGRRAAPPLPAAPVAPVEVNAGGTIDIRVTDDRVIVTGRASAPGIGYNIGRGLSMAGP